MRSLKIELFDEEYYLIKKIIAGRFDASLHLTIISESFNTKNKTIRLPFEIDHWNIFEGMVTIYYKCGCLLEVSRIND
jgi:hypothetical protein